MNAKQENAEVLEYTETLLVASHGTRMGYFKPPKAFREMYPKADARIGKMPEPLALVQKVKKGGKVYVRLIYEWKEEELCQNK